MVGTVHDVIEGSSVDSELWIKMQRLPAANVIKNVDSVVGVLKR